MPSGKSTSVPRKASPRDAEQYRILFESNPLPMWVYDAKTLRFLAVNRAAVEKYGYSQKEFLAMTIKDIRPPEDVPRLMENLTNARVDFQQSGLWRHMSKTGEMFEVEIVSHSLEFDGIPSRLVLVNDVTRRRRAEEAAKEAALRYRTTLDHMLEGCQIIDRDYRYVYVNDVAARHGRTAKEDLLGHTMMEKYPGIEQSEMFHHLRRCVEQRVPHVMENEFTYPDGSKGWFQLSMEPVPEGVFILSSDITKEKRQEEELRAYREQLEQLVKQRTVQLEEVNRELEAFSYS
ncbi:MAG: PAS domain S-box protein, partial [Ignavibacterium sp.]